MRESPAWFEGLPVAVTVTDHRGTILDMNAYAREAFAAYGGGELVGKNIFECHPEPARLKAEELYREQRPNHYTIQQGEARKIIHQVPWFRGDLFAGYVEFSMVVSDALPHFDRNLPSSGGDAE